MPAKVIKTPLGATSEDSWDNISRRGRAVFNIKDLSENTIKKFSNKMLEEMGVHPPLAYTIKIKTVVVAT